MMKSIIFIPIFAMLPKAATKSTGKIYSPVEKLVSFKKLFSEIVPEKDEKSKQTFISNYILVFFISGESTLFLIINKIYMYILSKIWLKFSD